MYTENLITGLLEVGGVAITVLYSDERCRTAPYGSQVEWLWEAARPYSVDEMLRMPARIDLSRFDIFHTPHYMLPYRIPIPTVVTVHDSFTSPIRRSSGIHQWRSFSFAPRCDERMVCLR